MTEQLRTDTELSKEKREQIKSAMLRLVRFSTKNCNILNLRKIFF